MAVEPIVAPAQLEPPPVYLGEAGAERPTPTPEQEQAADGVFSPAAEKAAAALLGVHMGLNLLHHLAVEAAPQPEEKPKPRPRDEEKDEPAA